MKRILITGCAGFIGFHLVKKLKNKYEIDGIDNLNDYYDKNLKINRLNLISEYINFKEIDISNFVKLSNFFLKNKYDCVIHLAAQAGVRYSFQNPQSYINSNILGTFNILELIKKNKNSHFVFSSTSSVYGIRDDKKPFTESSNTNNPISLYAATKKNCEVLIHNYSYNFKIPSTILRFFTVYGPWGRPDMALFKFIKSTINKEPIDVFNDGNMWRDFTYVEDLVEAISRIISQIPLEKNRVKDDSLSNVAPYRVINIGNQNSVNLNDFIKTLENIMKVKIKRNNLTMQPGDVSFTLSNSSLLRTLTGFTPSTSVEEGITKFYEWYLNYNK